LDSVEESRLTGLNFLKVFDLYLAILAKSNSYYSTMSNPVFFGLWFIPFLYHDRPNETEAGKRADFEIVACFIGVTLASIPRTFRDGTSNTIAFAERYQMCNGTPCAWGYSSVYYWAPMFAYYSKGKFQNAPKQENCTPALPQATDRAGIQVAIADGSARTVSENISSETWYNATDPADGNLLGPDW
jgi:hypothetical protein